MMCMLVILSLWASLGAITAHADDPPNSHVVQSGDTLWDISQQFGISVEALIAANQLQDANFLSEGQRLVIPSSGQQDQTQTNTPDANTSEDPAASTGARLNTPLEVLLQRHGLTMRKLQLMESEYSPLEPPPPNLPEPFFEIAYTPEIIQGQTGVVRVTLTEAITPTARYGNFDLSVLYRDKTREGYRYEALIPTWALAKVAPRKLIITADKEQISRTFDITRGNYETQHIVLPPGKGELLEPQKTRAELKQLTETWQEFDPAKLWRGSFQFPTDEEHRRTSPFGTRRSYNDGPVTSYHAGTDWSAPEGTPIKAPAPGVIALAEPLEVRGGAVIIDHGRGVFSNFWHLSEILAEPGQHVELGDIVGLVGSTGLSTGAHLHWEIRVNGVAVDPMQWAEAHFPNLPLYSP